MAKSFALQQKLYENSLALWLKFVHMYVCVYSKYKSYKVIRRCRHFRRSGHRRQQALWHQHFGGKFAQQQSVQTSSRRRTHMNMVVWCMYVLVCA